MQVELVDGCGFWRMMAHCHRNSETARLTFAGATSRPIEFLLSKLRHSCECSADALSCLHTCDSVVSHSLLSPRLMCDKDGVKIEKPFDVQAFRFMQKRVSTLLDEIEEIGVKINDLILVVLKN